MSNSKRCPFCNGWIPLPLRRADAAFEKHKKECDPAGWQRQQDFEKELLGGGMPDLLAPPEEMTDKTRTEIAKVMLERDSDTASLEELETAEGIIDALTAETPSESQAVRLEPVNQGPTIMIWLDTIPVSEAWRLEVGRRIGKKGTATRAEFKKWVLDTIRQELG